MSTTPPENQGTSYSGMGRSPVSGAILPVPGNAELAVWFTEQAETARPEGAA